MGTAAEKVKLLVTGSAGFIGSHLTEALLARGDTVVGIDNFNDYYSPAQKRRNLAAAKRHTNFRQVEGDIEERARIAALIADEAFDAVVHLAARAGVRPSIENPEIYERTNGLGTLNLLDAMAAQPKANRPRLLFASSSSVYGTNSKLPFSEADPIVAPVSPYAATKRSNELMAHAFHAVHGLAVYALRYFTVYGPRQRPEMAIARFLANVHEGRRLPFFGDGSTRRDYTFVGDIVAGTVAALDQLMKAGGFEIYNLGGDHTTSLTEMVATVEAVVGRSALIERLPDQAGDVPATWADVSKARRELAWTAKTELRSGIAAQYAWWRSENERTRNE